MNSIFNYYNNKIIPFSIGGRRKVKVLPLLENIRGSKILDIGCASGYIGSILRRQDNYVVGLDITKKDIAKARKILNKAYVFDIESDDLRRLGKDYDLIIMMEVPEHLFDPEAAIARFLPLLKPGGELLLSTPNFVHVYNRLKVALGIFEYKEETVINKSHIHFFTYATFLKALSSLGLKIVRENNVILPETLSPFLKFWPSLFVFQMVVLARKPNN